jgi:hypothetical protein
VKSFVRKKYCKSNFIPNIFYTTHGAVTVGEDGNTWEGTGNRAWREPIIRIRIALHHYAVKSREEYEEKMERSKIIESGKTDWNWIDYVDAHAHTPCPQMAQYEP